MAVLNFPSAPANGDLFNAADRTWRWNSTTSRWETAGRTFPYKLTVPEVQGYGGSSQNRLTLRSDSFVYIETRASDDDVNPGRIVISAYGGALVLPGFTGNFTWAGNTIWHSGNDGAGSGLVADQLDGQEGSYYQNASNLNAGTIPDGRFAARAESNPAVTALSGAFTTVAATLNRQRVGDSILWDLTVTITTNGTAAGAILVAMPFTALKECVAAGREAGVTGAMCQGVMAAGSSNLVILKYDNAYPGGDGYRVSLSGHAFVS